MASSVWRAHQEPALSVNQANDKDQVGRVKIILS